MSARLDGAVAAVADGRQAYERSNGGAGADTLRISSSTWGSLVSMSTSNTPAADVLRRLGEHGITTVLVDGKPVSIGGDL